MQSPIFIVGPHRAGSTLWHNLVAMCPGVVRLADPMFLGPKRQRDFAFFLRTQARELGTKEDVETFVKLCLSRKQLPGLESAFWRFEGIDVVDRSEFRAAVVDEIYRSDRSIGAIARILVTQITAFSGAERAVMKFPVDVQHMGELLRWFPDCRVMHITRDPRGLAMSKSNDPSGTAIRTLRHPRLAWFIRKAALLMVIAEYRASARVHQKFKGTPGYQLFQYESLLADPEGTLRGLCSFLDLPFQPELLHPERGHHEHQPSSHTGKRQKAFDTQAALRWRSAISRPDNLLIYSCTRSSMRRLGYDPKRHPIFRAPGTVTSEQVHSRPGALAGDSSR